MFKNLKRKLDQWKRIEITNREKYKVSAGKIDYSGNGDGTTG